jgi:hypothetical protein
LDGCKEQFAAKRMLCSNEFGELENITDKQSKNG